MSTGREVWRYFALFNFIGTNKSRLWLVRFRVSMVIFALFKHSFLTLKEITLIFQIHNECVISVVESGDFKNPDIYITPPGGVETDEDSAGENEGGLIDNLNRHQLEAEAEAVVRTSRYYRSRC